MDAVDYVGMFCVLALFLAGQWLMVRSTMWYVQQALNRREFVPQKEKPFKAKANAPTDIDRAVKQNKAHMEARKRAEAQYNERMEQKLGFSMDEYKQTGIVRKYGAKEKE